MNANCDFERERERERRERRREKREREREIIVAIMVLGETPRRRPQLKKKSHTLYWTALLQPLRNKKRLLTLRH